MSSVPYIFANSSGNIPLSELDSNFSNVKAQVDSANVVSDAAQPAITSVGILNNLTTSGNVFVENGSITSTGPLIMVAGGDALNPNNNYIQMQWATDVANPDTGKNQYIWADTNGAHINTSDYSVPYDNQWWFRNNGDTEFPGNADIAGSINASADLIVDGSVYVGGNTQLAGIFSVGPYTKAVLNTITGIAGSMAAVLDSPVRQGRIAYWDLTFNRWSYINDNSAV